MRACVRWPCLVAQEAGHTQREGRHEERCAKQNATHAHTHYVCLVHYTHAWGVCIWGEEIAVGSGGTDTHKQKLNMGFISQNAVLGFSIQRKVRCGAKGVVCPVPVSVPPASFQRVGRSGNIYTCCLTAPAWSKSREREREREARKGRLRVHHTQVNNNGHTSSTVPVAGVWCGKGQQTERKKRRERERLREGPVRLRGGRKVLPPRYRR